MNSANAEKTSKGAMKGILIAGLLLFTQFSSLENYFTREKMPLWSKR
jgi:hypothetical protein